MIAAQFYGSAKNVTVTADYHLQTIYRYQVITIGDSNQYNLFLPNTSNLVLGGTWFNLVILSGGSLVLKNRSGTVIPFLKYNGVPEFGGVIAPLDGSWENNQAQLSVILPQGGGWVAFPANSS